jgi:hypothetical protein
MQPVPFAAKLTLTLKALSLSRGRLASDLEVDKSVIARWLAGQVKPSEYNLTRLTAVIAGLRPGFTMLDWDRDLPDFADLMGAGTGKTRFPQGLALPLLEQIGALTDLRGAAYEGFFRTTRPSALMPGRFLHDHGIVRRDATGLLTYRMGIAGTEFHGWLLPIQNQLFCISTDMTSGTMVFAIFNGVAHHRSEIIDGITLSTALDAARTITAAPIILSRLGDLTGDEAADDAHYRELITRAPLAPEGSVPQAVCDHLARDFGPDQLAKGGDWLLCMTLARSMARGPGLDSIGAPPAS